MAATLKIDKDTRNAIVAAINKATDDRMLMYQEEWVTSEELCKRLPMFSPDWVRHYGNQLPRERLEMENSQGDVCYVGKRWMYPLHRIMKDIEERKHKHFQY